jgi:transposase
VARSSFGGCSKDGEQLKIASFSLLKINTVSGEQTTTVLRLPLKLQYDGYLRREETNAAILALAAEGIAIKDIVRRTGHSRKLVRQVIRGERTDVFRVRQSSIEVYLPLLDELWNSGCRNGAELWRRLKAKGFPGALRVVSEWATRRRRADRASDQQLQKVPPAPKDRTNDDHGSRSSEQGRYDRHRGDRGRRPHAGQSP